MPTYEYICTACEHELEIYQALSDKALKKCPSCKKMKLQRVISGGAGIVFKGGGFYETDYKRGEGSDYKKKSDKENKGGDSKKSETKKESPVSDKKEKKSKPASKSSK